MDNTDIADVLEAAADYMFVHGKCTGRYFDPNSGKVCAMGAVNMICSKEWSTTLRENWANWAFSRHLVRRYSVTTFPSWGPSDIIPYVNDKMPEVDIIDEFRLCAKDLRNG